MYGVTPQNPKGGIPPLSAVNVFLPKGVKLHPQGFGTCTEATLKSIGPSGCSKKSIASPLGNVLGEVTFGTERVPEEATLQAFFGPGGGLLFFTKGSSPVSLEIVSTGRYVRSSGKYSWELKTLVPPVASVPGAPLASARKIHIKVGAAFRKHRSQKRRMPARRLLRKGRSDVRRFKQLRRIRHPADNRHQGDPGALPKALGRRAEPKDAVSDRRRSRSGGGRSLLIAAQASCDQGTMPSSGFGGPSSIARYSSMCPSGSWK